MTEPVLRCSRALRAEQRVRFLDAYRSYVINYNLGKDLVRAYIEGVDNATPDNTAQRWAEFGALFGFAACHPGCA